MINVEVYHIIAEELNSMVAWQPDRVCERCSKDSLKRMLKAST